LGYNLTLNDSLELINQVFIDLPQAGQGVAVGITLGFIASLPAAG
jgi:hypothetical protein